MQRALELHRQGKLEEAEAVYRAVVAVAPTDFDALHLWGIAEYQLGRNEEAIALFDRAIAVGPNDVFGRFNRALALTALKRFDEALSGWDQVLKLKPDYPEAHFNRGNALRELKRPDEARASYERALRLKPAYNEALHNLGIMLMEARRLNDALACWDRLLRSDAKLADVHVNRAITLQALNRYDEALASYARAAALKPDFIDIYGNRGTFLATELLLYEEAIPDFERVLGLDPEHPYARGHLLHMRMHCCDWRNFEWEVQAITTDLRAGKRVCWPFVFQAISDSPADLKTCAEILAADFHAPERLSGSETRYKHDKIRLGYVSGEFLSQATSYLTAGLYEAHNKTCFELFAFDNGFDDGSAMRKRLQSAFDNFIDISRLSDRAAAEAIRECEIDILINLNGYFGRERTLVFALKPSPIQVNWLGFPGTLGTSFMDYIIADRIVIPEDERRFYNEKVVYLPHTYQVNDSRRLIASRIPTRMEVGLPQRGFVFASFNNTYKYTPAMFDIWMRLLRAVDGSVLWLYENNGAVARYLKSEAEARGVSPERLVFARRVPLEDHLARQQLADLFLDSLPYNAHTTASDALWTGLPVLTCAGSAFAGRVAASLLHAIGVPELITHSLEDYEALALKLARDPASLGALRMKLAANRLTTPLFDTDRFHRNLEAAYTEMWRRHERGEAPDSFSVTEF